MRAEIESTLEKPKNRTPRLIDDLFKKLGLGKSIAHFPGNDDILSTLELNQIQTHKNSRARAEIERQQSNGLIYANIAKFR